MTSSGERLKYGVAAHRQLASQVTCDNAEDANYGYHGMMRELVAQELIAKANQAILEAHWLRRQGRALRIEASVRASELGETILGVHAGATKTREDGNVE